MSSGSDSQTDPLGPPTNEHHEDDRHDSTTTARRSQLQNPPPPHSLSPPGPSVPSGPFSPEIAQDQPARLGPSENLSGPVLLWTGPVASSSTQGPWIASSATDSVSTAPAGSSRSSSAKGKGKAVDHEETNGVDGNISKRTMQNRKAQREFRQRKAAYVRDLEERVRQYEISRTAPRILTPTEQEELTRLHHENDRLAWENDRLRTQLENATGSAVPPHLERRGPLAPSIPPTLSPTSSSFQSPDPSRSASFSQLQASTPSVHPQFPPPPMTGPEPPDAHSTPFTRPYPSGLPASPTMQQGPAPTGALSYARDTQAALGSSTFENGQSDLPPPARRGSRTGARRRQPTSTSSQSGRAPGDDQPTPS